MLRECCGKKHSDFLWPRCSMCGTEWPAPPKAGPKGPKRMVAVGNRHGTTAVIDGERVTFSVAQMDAAMDRLMAACAQGQHPRDAIGPDGCGVCGRAVAS
jgi:hypothetical protein